MKHILMNIWQLLVISDSEVAVAKFSFNDSTVVNQISINASVHQISKQELMNEIMVLLNQNTENQESLPTFSHRVHHISPFGIKPIGRIYYNFSIDINQNKLIYSLSNFKWKDINRNRYGRFIGSVRGRRKDLILFRKRLSSAQKLSITKRINHEMQRIHQYLTSKLGTT